MWKVEYETPTGRRSTAYVSAEHDDQTLCSGTDKYTDDPVTVEWDGEQWRQVAR
jgi:hypothetical protein